MLKTILSVFLMLYAAASFAAVDANKANAAELDSVKGVGPAMSTRILDERKKSNFKDWPDLMHRVSGMGEKSSAKLSAQGLTVNGSVYQGTGASEPNKDKGSDKAADKSKAAKS